MCCSQTFIRPSNAAVTGLLPAQVDNESGQVVALGGAGARLEQIRARAVISPGEFFASAQHVGF